MKHPLRLHIGNPLRKLSLARSVRLVRLLGPALGEGTQRRLVLSVFVAIAIAGMILVLGTATDGLVTARLTLLKQVPTWACCLLLVGFPTIGALVIGKLMERLAPDAGGSGIPQVKASYHLRNGGLRGRVVPVKLALCALAIGSGLSLGREGPSIHIGGAFGSWVAQRLSVKRAKMKHLCAVGSACGMAAAFNTPIAAILFLFEEIVGDLRQSFFGVVVVAVVVATATSVGFVGDAPRFGDLVHVFHWSEIFAYAALGLVAGWGGRGFLRLILTTRRRACARFADRTTLRFLFAGAGTGMVAALVYATTGIPFLGAHGVESISSVLAQSHTLPVLALLCVATMVATAFSYASLIPGGIFAPSLFVGATLGAVVARTFDALPLESLLPALNPTAFAVVGMAALFGGITRSPMTAVMLVVEITDDYHLVLPLMLATTLAVVVVQLRYRGSIYDQLLRQDKVIIYTYAQHAFLAETLVDEAMSPQVRRLECSLGVREALERVDREDHGALYVVTNEEGRMIGLVSPTDLVWEVARGDREQTLRELVAEQRIIHAHPDQTLESVIEKLTHFDISELPVVPRDNEKGVIGLIGIHEITEFRHRLDENQLVLPDPE